METGRRIVIFCSSSYDIDPAYNEAARALVRAACASGFTIVSGGAVKGTMGVVSDEVTRCGGRHIGVLPHFMAEYRYPGLTQLVWTDTMSVRKEKMREGTCAAIALPGGPGTLDELFETLTLAKLDRYPGKVVAFNVAGFYDPLKRMMCDLCEKKMMDAHARDLLHFPETVEEVMALLEAD